MNEKVSIGYNSEALGPARTYSWPPAWAASPPDSPPTPPSAPAASDPVAIVQAGPAPAASTTPGIDFSTWVLRPDVDGRLGWEPPGTPERERWWARCRFDDLPRPVDYPPARGLCEPQNRKDA
jgi:hypothetical protein